MVWQGGETSWRGSAGFGVAWLGTARLGMAWQGRDFVDGSGVVRQGVAGAWPNEARLGEAELGRARPGTVGLSEVWRGSIHGVVGPEHGRVRLGVASWGMAGLGEE